MSKVTRITAASTILASSVLLSGCGFFGADKKAIDPPKDVSTVEDQAALEKETGAEAAEEGTAENAESVKTELYLIDKNGYVVPQTIDLPKQEGVAKQALEHLVENGPLENIMPNGFRAVLPADTQVTVDIKDGVAVADFSKEFKNYKKEDELKILQAVTWTLTQFDSVESVKLRLNGEDLNQMPVNGTPIQDGISRSAGINLDMTAVKDISNTKGLTVYYVGGEEGNYYYVPVTKRISQDETDNVLAVVQQLAKGPSRFSANLQSVLMSDVALLTQPQLEDGKVTLNFNESILGSFKEKKVSQEVLDTLVLSLTEQSGIKNVELMVEGKSDLVNEEGKPLSEPVSRPEQVNTGSF